MSLNGYLSRLPSPPTSPQMQQVLDMIRDAKRPVVYAGGGCLDAAPELKEFIESTGIPITNTLMGLGCYPASDELCLDMLGMHGAVYANYAVDSADLLLAFGVRFDDRVTGKLEAFAARASIVHIDIDPAEIGKNKEAHCPVFSNIKPALRTLNSIIRRTARAGLFRVEGGHHEAESQFRSRTPRRTITSSRSTPWSSVQDDQGKAVVSTGVGSINVGGANTSLTSRAARIGQLGLHGLRPPAALAPPPRTRRRRRRHRRRWILRHEHRGTATLHAENLPVKMFVLNNQRLGMVVQWEDKLQAPRGHMPRLPDKVTR